jgi:hypothetical protein
LLVVRPFRPTERQGSIERYFLPAALRTTGGFALTKRIASFIGAVGAHAFAGGKVFPFSNAAFSPNLADRW